MRPGEHAERFGIEALVGREREIAVLRALLEESASGGSARAAVVVGPAGIGKSRLAQEIAMLAAERGTAVWTARGDPSGRPAPFGALGDALYRLARVAPGDALAERRSKLRERVGRFIQADALWQTTTVLGEAAGTSFFDTTPGTGTAESSEPAARQPGGSVLLADLVLGAWEDLLAAELSQGPILLLIDDAQWVDPPSMRLFDAALRNLPDRPLSVIALGRLELRTAFPGLFADRGATEIEIEELSDEAAREFLTALARDRLGPDALATLAARARGNPFMLEGLARAAAESGSADLPDTVLAMAAARVDAAPPETRAVLRVASVLGEVFDRDDLAALIESAMDGGALDAAIDDACARELLERRLTGYAVPNVIAFRSGLVRDVAYSLFSDEDRARAHRLAAHRLGRVHRDPAILAWHFDVGGAPAQAIEPYRLAALRALGANDFEAAIARARRAEVCGATGSTLGELARILADAHAWRGETEEAGQEARRALGLLSAGSIPWFQAVTAYAIAASRLGNTEAIYAAARDVEGLIASRPASEVEPGLRAVQVTAMSRLAIALVFQGDVPSAEPMLGRMHALRMAGALDAMPFALGFAHRAHAIRAHVRGELFPAFLSFDAAAASFERAGALRDACVDHANTGFMKTELGQNEDAEARLTGALGTARRLGLPTVTANAQLNLCLLLTRRGAAIPAGAMGETALAIYEKQGSPRMIAIALVYVSRALAAGGAAAAAQQRAKRATCFADDVPPYKAYAFAALSAAERALGRPEDALHAAETAMEALREVGAEEGEAFVRLSFAEALTAAGRAEEARSALAEADMALAARALKIADGAHREAFLRNIPEHARTVELAAAVGVGAMSRARTIIPR